MVHHKFRSLIQSPHDALVDKINALPVSVLLKCLSIQQASPQMLATLVYSIQPKLAGHILASLPRQIQIVIMQLSKQSWQPDSTALHDFLKIIYDEACLIQQQSHQLGGPNQVARILDHLPKELALSTLEQLRSSRPDLAEKLQEGLWRTDKILEYSPQSLQQSLRHLTDLQICIILTECSVAVTELLMSQISERRRLEILELQTTRPKVPRSDLQTALAQLRMLLDS